MDTENQVISSWHQQFTRKPVKGQDAEKSEPTNILRSNNAICNQAHNSNPMKKNLSAKSIASTRSKGLTQGGLVRKDTNKLPKNTPPPSGDNKKSMFSHKANSGENNKENIDPNAQALANLSLKSTSSPKGSPKLKRDAKSRLKRI